MLELFVLVVFVMAIVAITKANRAINENDTLRAELSRLRHSIERKPALERQDQREQSVVDTPAPSGVPQHAPTEPVSVTPPPIPDAIPDDIPTVAAPQPAAQTTDPAPAVGLPAAPQLAPVFTVQQPEPKSIEHESPVPEIHVRPETEPSVPETSVPLVARTTASGADGGGSVPAEPAAASSGGDTERTIATQWTVWIGGIALAMGSLLIVKFSIEAGYFGPGVRLILGALFSLALAVASEIIRRQELKLNIGRTFTDHIPAVLAGVSVLGAFGVAYAAHAVYDMISPGLAFAIMGAVGLSALAASLLHGPRFGLFGLVGSYVTPIMIGGIATNYMALSIFIAIVTTAAFFLHLRRPSTALLAGAVIGHTIWTGLIALGPDTLGWGSFLLIAAIALATLLTESAERSPQRRDIDAGTLVTLTVLAAFAAPLVLAGFLWVEMGGGLTSRLTLTALVAGNILAAIRHRGLAPLAPLAGAAAVGLILLWPDLDGPLRVSLRLIFDLARLDLVPRAAPGLALFAIVLGLLVSVPLLGSLFAPWRNGGSNPISRGCIAFAAALTPVCMMLAASLRINGFNRTTGFAIIAAVLALACAAISELLYRREQERAQDVADPLSFIGSAAFAAAGAIAIGLAIAFALRETWLVVGFAVASAGVALVARRRAIPLLRTITASLATAALARVIWQPALSGLGDWPLLNWIVVVYGLPALAFAVAAWALSARRDRASMVVESLAALFLTLLVAFELIQAFVGGNLWDVEQLFNFAAEIEQVVSKDTPATALTALLTMAAAVLAALFMALRRRTQSPVFAIAEKALMAAAAALAIAGLGFFLNPVVNGVPVLEPVVLNRLLAYLLLALALALIANTLPRQDHRNLLQSTLELLAIVVGVLGAVLVLRHWFTGPDMSIRTITSVSYAESVATTLLLLASAAVVALWRDRRESDLLASGVTGVAILAMTFAAVMLGIIKNPIIDGSLVEGPIVFNRLLWGYAPVAIAFVALARLADPSHGLLNRTLRLGGGRTASLMLFLMIRHGFHGPELISDVPITFAEAGVYGSLALIAEFLFSRYQKLRAEASSDPLREVLNALLAVGLHVILLTVAFASDHRIVGWLILNNSLTALLMPAALS